MIEAILRLSINKRYLILTLVAGIIALGVFSYQHLAIDAVPDITNVQVQVNTNAPGYSPLETEQRITYPIETALYGLPKLDYTRSLSRYGLSQVTVVFEEGTDIYFARNLINERLSAIKNTLPKELEPTMGPIATGLGEVISYTVEAEEGAKKADGSAYTPMDLREIQDWLIKPQLALSKGVVEINTIGGFDKQFQVLPNPKQLLYFGISLWQLSAAINNNNQNQGAGFIEKQGQQLLVRSTGQVKTTDDIGNIVVSQKNGQVIKVKDLATVSIGHALRSGAATKNGNETVLGTAMMLMGENSRDVAIGVEQRLQAINKTLPNGVHINIVYNRTTLVDKAIATVQKNLLEGALLVIVVLFLLLGNIRAALITAAVIPLSMLLTLFGMAKTGVSANLMSLGALDFGLIVDGSVIIVENAIRRLSQHKNPLPLKERLAVVFDACNEVVRPSLFGVAIITLVYLPIFSLTGVEGKMFHPMAATVVMALLAAMLISLTLVPAAIAVFLKGPISEKESAVIRHGKSFYKPLLDKALNAPKTILLSQLVLLAACVFLASRLGAEFVPQLDEGDIAMHALRIPGTSLSQSVAMQKQVEQAVMQHPEVEHVFSKIGTPELATDPMPPNVADTIIILKPHNKWPDSAKTKAQLLAELQESVQQLPGNNYEFTQPIEMRFNELISGVRADLGIKIFGDDLSLLKKSAGAILAELNAIDGASSARIEQVDGLPMIDIKPKPSALARYALSLKSLQQQVATAIGGSQAGLVYLGDKRFAIQIRLPEALRQDTYAYQFLPIMLEGGGYVPLSEVAKIEQTLVPNQISRENGKRRVVVTSNVTGRDLASFVNEAKKRIDENVELPSGYWLNFDGTFKQLASASKRLSLIIPATLLGIFIMLIMAFNSIKDASIIFTGVPLALTGGVLALWARGMPLSISAGVGFIALSGIAVLNSLVLLAFIREKAQKLPLQQAIVEGAVLRLRPVLMTALVASLGFVPMAFNTGTGAEVQRPLATVVIGGIVSSTLLTLLVLPLLYKLLHQKR